MRSTDRYYSLRWTVSITSDFGWITDNPEVIHFRVADSSSKVENPQSKVNEHWRAFPSTKACRADLKALNECFGLWLLKNSFSAQTASNPVIENVYPVRENRL